MPLNAAVWQGYRWDYYFLGWENVYKLNVLPAVGLALQGS